MVRRGANAYLFRQGNPRGIFGIGTVAAGAKYAKASSLADGRRKILRSIMLRRGQRQFRDQLLAAYGSKCCVTGCNIPELLEAAHIVPYRGDDTNRVDNGLLLRSDIHMLFDCGLITVDCRTQTLQVSERLKVTGYWKLNSKKLRMPTTHQNRPNPAALQFHQESWRSG
jgi:putative restriction endonuclease